MSNNQLKAIFARQSTLCLSKWSFSSSNFFSLSFSHFGREISLQDEHMLLWVHTRAIVARLSGASWLKHNECWICSPSGFKVEKEPWKYQKALLNPPRLICSQERRNLCQLDDPEADPNGQGNMSWIGRHVKLSIAIPLVWDSTPCRSFFCSIVRRVGFSSWSCAWRDGTLRNCSQFWAWNRCDWHSLLSWWIVQLFHHPAGLPTKTNSQSNLGSFWHRSALQSQDCQSPWSNFLLCGSLPTSASAKFLQTARSCDLPAWAGSYNHLHAPSSPAVARAQWASSSPRDSNARSAFPRYYDASRNPGPCLHFRTPISRFGTSSNCDDEGSPPDRPCSQTELVASDWARPPNFAADSRSHGN